MLGLAIKFLLASVTAITVSTNLAKNEEAQGNYISDVKLVYAKNLNGALSEVAKKEGYELADTTPIYKYDEGGYKQEHTYLAIKKTDDVNDAITDIRAMNMVGGWSTNSYADVLENQKAYVENLITFIKPAIAHFKNDYKAGMEKAKQGTDNGISFADIILNSLYFDDVTDPKTGKPITIRDLFLQYAEPETFCTDENLKTLFMQGNSKAIYSIETALMYASVALQNKDEVKEGTNFYLKQFAQYKTISDCLKIEEHISSEEIDMMVDSIKDLKDTLNIFVDSGFAKKLPTAEEPTKEELQQLSDDLSSYLSCLSYGDALNFQISLELYATLAGYGFMEDGPIFGNGSLVEFILNFNENDKKFETQPEMIYPFIVSMTGAQRCTYSFTGLDNFLLAINNENKVATLEDGTKVPYLNVLVKEYKDSITDKETHELYITSVFAGVDRRIFKAEGIGLTSAAMREQNAKNDYNWFKTDETAEEILECIAMGCLATSLCTLGLCALTYGGCVFVSLCRLGIRQGPVAGRTFSYVFSQGTFSQGVRFWAELEVNQVEIAFMKKYPKLYRWALNGHKAEFEVIRMCRVIDKVMKVIKVAATAAGVILGAAMIVDFARKIVELATEEEIKYEPIPEIMVDEKLINDEAVYSYYYNVRNIADDKVADVTKASASYHKHSQWVSLFYSKDKTLGSAIKAGSFKVYTTDEKVQDAIGVKKFGEQGLYSVTKYTAEKNPQKAYITYETVDIVSSEKEIAIDAIERYAYESFEKFICNIPSIISTYKQRINDAHTVSEVNSLRTEAINALNKEKINNYDIVYPVIEQITNLGDITLPDKNQVEAARESYDKLSDTHKQYVDNYTVLVSAEVTIYKLELEQDKITALKETKEYMNKQTNLGSDAEKEKLYNECQEVIMNATTKEELSKAKQIAFDKVDAKVAEKESQAASTFGKGNLGLLFIGITGGLILGGVGVWFTLRYLNKTKKKETKKQDSKK